MRGRLPLDKNMIDKVSDIFFKKSQQVLQQNQDEDVQGGFVEGGGMPGVGGHLVPLPGIADRSHDVREIISNYEKLEKLVYSNRKMWQRMLDSDGKDTGGFLDDPKDWNDKHWSEAVKKTERLVRDANNALMKIGEIDVGSREEREIGEELDREKAGEVEEEIEMIE